MADLAVTFTAGGETIVHRSPRAIVEGEFANWRIHSENPDVKWVRVIFEDENLAFFPKKGGSYQHFCDKKYADGMMIWGQPGAAPGETVSDEKYTVQGLTKKPPANGDAVDRADIATELDPQIIINRP